MKFVRVTTSENHLLRRMLLMKLSEHFPGIRGAKRRALLTRLIDVAGWYAAGINRLPGQVGRPPDIAVQALLSDCATALLAIGRGGGIWQRDKNDGGTPESESVRLARVVAHVVGLPLGENLRRQAEASRTLV